jgi:hypothetical protein
LPRSRSLLQPWATPSRAAGPAVFGIGGCTRGSPTPSPPRHLDTSVDRRSGRLHR